MMDRDKMPPPPPYSGMPPCRPESDRGLHTKYLAIILLIVMGFVIYGGRVLADRHAEQPDYDPSLADTIIASWILYKDNTGVGAYVHLKADGSLKLTEGRLGEWMVTRHRLVEEDGSAYLEFYDVDTENWIRFMMISSDQEKEIRLTYLE